MKLPKVKTLEAKVWDLCRSITRIRYPNTCFTCGKENLEGKQWHTGHFIKKRKLPFEMKYDLRILRPQCQYCNLRQNGNEGMYAINIIKTEGVEYLLEIDKDIKLFSSLEPMNQPQQREYLENLIISYKNILDKYNQEL
jgi:hypothetical protein